MNSLGAKPAEMTGDIDIETDWLRLISQWCRKLSAGDAPAQELLATLSTEGVTSELAQQSDPERADFYH